MTDDSDLFSLTDDQFLEQAYRRALGRPVDPRGMREYLRQLRSGMAKPALLAELQSSPEGRAYAARSGAPGGSGNGGGRSPSRAGGSGRAGGGRPVTLAALLEAEPAEFVAQVYRLLLGREPDPTGFRIYTSALSTGAHRLDVMRQLMQSDEGRQFAGAPPELREAVQRRRFMALPGVRHAARLFRAATGGGLSPAKAAALLAARRARRSKRVAAFSAANAYPNNPKKSMMEATPDTRETDLPTTRLRDLAAAAAAPQPTPASFADETAQASGTGSSAFTVERFVGGTVRGSSFMDGHPRAVAVEFGGRALGRITPHAARPELQQAYALESDVVGFDAVLGGLLQFYAMAPQYASIDLAQAGDGGARHRIELEPFLPEALTFAPMRALMRTLPTGAIGQIRAMRLVGPLEASMIFEAEAPSGEPQEIFIDLYQQPREGSLARIARFAVPLAGQIADLEFRMLDALKPVLMVVTNADRGILATDCFPLPELLSESNAPLLEYHVVLETGKQPFGVVAKIARSFLDVAIRKRLGMIDASATGPAHATSTLLLYVQQIADIDARHELQRLGALGRDAAFIQRDGQVLTANGRTLPLAGFLEEDHSRDFLLHDAEAEIRPDFWAVLEEHRFRVKGSPPVVHWDSIWIDGTSRPVVVKAGLLLDPAFAGHALLHARSLLVRRDVLIQAVQTRAPLMRSGSLVAERAFDFVDPRDAVRLPIVMDTVRVPLVMLGMQRLAQENALPATHPAQVSTDVTEPGVSIIINYRDSAGDTIRCLESIRAQAYQGPLDVILVNNGSTVQSVHSVVGRARDLFGESNVQPIDYPHRFNHSDQCNVAALAAKHDLLLMLSNDSALRTPGAIARSARLALVPWVGTVGYRIVGSAATKGRVQSVGLQLTERRYLFSGGSPITTAQVPAFAIDCTFEMVGNTFAAVMLRKSVYMELDGLDTQAFPTSYNDVDFSFRATRAGYRHVVIGSEVVEHMGRGSREADQDLPIDQRIIERAPTLGAMTRVGFQTL